MIPKNKTAWILGVANHRSIAWACVERFLESNYSVIVSYQPRFERHIQPLLLAHPDVQALPLADITTDLSHAALQVEAWLSDRPLNAVVHSVAFGNVHVPLSQVSWQDYSKAQHVSAYSFLELARVTKPYMTTTSTTGSSSSLTTLSYIGATRAVPNYGLMGPAKASLEAVVRGLAVEFQGIRVNAVSAGPIPTLSSRMIPNFNTLHHLPTPWPEPVTAQHVAHTVHFLAHEATSITGQVIYVDGGFHSSVMVPTT